MTDQHVMQAFGEAVADARVERRIPQAELGRRAGLSQPAISAIETGQRAPAITVVVRLARALNIPPAQLVAAALTTPEETHP